jgi:hypothetical protein
MKDIFEADEVPQFWLLVKNHYPSLSDKAMNVLLPFLATYFFETGFYAVAVMNIKYRSLFATEKEVRVAISSLAPEFGKLCPEQQDYPSH